MGSVPPITPELVERLEALQTVHMTSRLGCIAEAPGNPGRMEIRQFGHSTAFRMAGAGGWEYPNYCDGAEVSELDRIIAYYQETGIPPRFELSPAELTPELGLALQQRGFHHSRSHTVLYGVPVAQPPAAPANVTVDEVTSAADLETFLDVTLAAFGMKPGATEGAKVNQRRWLHRPGWTLFLARIGGRPAGGAVLYVHDRIGYLAYAGTPEEFRGRGCQAALIHARIARAAALGCEYVAGAAAFGSPSQRNQQRAGLQVAYLQSVWKSPPTAPASP